MVLEKIQKRIEEKEIIQEDFLSVKNNIIYARRITLRARLQNDNHYSRIYQLFIEIAYAKKY